MILQGDIVLTAFPFSNFSHTKMRPALVVSNNTINTSNDIILVGISSSYNSCHSIEIINNELDKGHLFVKSFVHCHKIHLTDKKCIKKVIGKLSDQKMNIITQKIIHYFS